MNVPGSFLGEAAFALSSPVRRFTLLPTAGWEGGGEGGGGGKGEREGKGKGGGRKGERRGEGKGRTCVRPLSDM